MSETPQTDAFENLGFLDQQMTWMDFARQLERQVASTQHLLHESLAREDRFYRELVEIQRTLNSAVEARIELAKDNLYLLKQLESIGTTDCMGVAGMTMRQAYKIAALHSLAKRLQNGNSYTAEDIADTCGELADAMTWEDKEASK